VENSQETSDAESRSVLEPISAACGRSGRILFHPFEIRKWFVLGFCAWLARLGTGGGAGGANWDVPDEGRAEREFERVQDWFVTHLGLAIGLVVLLVLSGILLWVLLTWLSSRGKFMFLDGVVHNRGAVVEPWHRFRAPGNSLLGLRLVLVILAVITIGVTVALPAFSFLAIGFDEDDLSFAAIVLLGVWMALIAALVCAFLLVGLIVNDFLVPIMWLRGCRALDAWPELRTLLCTNPGIFVLYALVKIVAVVVIGFFVCAAVCATCCIAAIPYLGTVLLLPLFVFLRSYSICFLTQFGPDYAALDGVE